MKSDLLFISPHLDDVVLSCSGLLINERLAGKKILVATIFSRGDDTAERKRQYEKRLQEDKLAMELLGLDYRWLDFPDAPVRNQIYDSFIGKHLETDPSDTELTNQISSALVKLWEETQPETTFFPLAIGSHIDHRLTFACSSALPEGAKVVYYEDRPYVFLNCALNLRFSEIGAAINDGLPSDVVRPDRRECVHSFLRSFDNVHAFDNYPARGKERFIAFRRMARIYLDTEDCNGYRFRPVRTLKTNKINQIAHAAAAYRSQFAGLFGSVEMFLKENLAYALTLGESTHTERYWGQEEK
jgi:LmbE family N-acetylglucosaminyl deacetylase